MKINKGMSVLLASMLIGGMLVGCNDNSNTDTTKTLTKRVEVTKDKAETKEATKDKTEVKATKDKEEKAPKDNKESSKKQVNTKKDNTDVKKDTKKKEPKKEKPKEKTKKKNTNTKKDTKEEHRGYYVTCPNGHKIYTENGDWDCIECDDDWQEQQDDSNIDEDEEYEPGYIKDGTHLGENNPDESIEVIEDPEYYE